MEWIDVKDRLPPLPKKVVEFYLVLVQRNEKILHRIAKWEKRIKRGEASNVESINKQLIKSLKADWRVCNFKSKEIIFWMPLPKPPEK